jgi:hypothetical protein
VGGRVGIIDGDWSGESSVREIGERLDVHESYTSSMRVSRAASKITKGGETKDEPNNIISKHESNPANPITISSADQ